MQRLSVAALTMAGLCVLAACGTSAASPTTGAPGTPAASAASAPGTPAASATSARVVIDEHSNGRAVHVAAGATIVVVLHNTYWRFGPPPTGGVLAEIGQPSPSPHPPGVGGCLPGMGCGTVTATFRATGAGRAVVLASRTTCGEAIRCRAGQGTFEVTIIVTG